VGNNAPVSFWKAGSIFWSRSFFMTFMINWFNIILFLPFLLASPFMIPLQMKGVLANTRVDRIWFLLDRKYFILYTKKKNEQYKRG